MRMLAGGLFALALAVAANQAPAVAAAGSCSDLAKLALPRATITVAAPVQAGAFRPDGDAGDFAALPAFCRVAATLKPTSDSDIRIEVWLPASGWNGKFQAVGNGGFSGAIAYPAMARALARGYAAASTDTGHAGNSASFALGHSEKLIDFGWRAVHEMTVAYARAVEASGGAEKVSGSYRLFLAPGMGHCGGGEGPNTFDMISALEQWVEAGKAPDQILASHASGGRVDRTRPLCPFPQVAVYKGSGSIDEAANFACRAVSQSAWTMPRTPDGHPDLQGIWTMHTYTPLVRPARYDGQEFLTEQEAAELTALLTQDDVDPLVSGIFGASDEERRKRVVQKDPTHYDNAQWLATGLKPLSSNRTSLIYDPPDGKIPPVTPDARVRAAARRAAAGFDSHENRPLQERCIIWSHEGPPMLPPPYNDVLQIVQTSDYFVVHRELSTAPRLIPTDGRPHVSARLQQLAGDSIGRWEGDTLVVDTTNFTGRTAFQGASSALHVVERFTRVGADTILYRFTVDDPNTWTRPWSAEIPMIATKGPLYEYACHEGNYGLANILSGARYTEKKARDPR